MFELGPMTDVAPLDPDVGRLYAVTTDDDTNKTYVCIRPEEWPDFMYIVLPANDYDKSIRISDIETCEPVAVVPKSRLGNVSDEFVWMASNAHLQPDVVHELRPGFNPVQGKDRTK